MVGLKSELKAMICILCQQEKRLCDSHIIPEFAYADIYDDKHRAVTFSPIAPDERKFEQKGVRDKLLCTDCEGFINDHFEIPFLKY